MGEGETGCDVMNRFWTWLTRFAYWRATRKDDWRGNRGRRRFIPVGLPGNRDPENPCSFYDPIKRHPTVLLPMEFGPCQTDGHYQCSDCSFIAIEKFEERYPKRARAEADRDY